MIKQKQIWALVANGGRASIVKSLGLDEPPRIVHFDAEQTRTGELMSDRAGRVFTSKSRSRSGMQLHTDPVRNQERVFAEKLIAYIEERMDAGDIDSLIIVASPRTLGDLRRVFPARYRDKIRSQFDKDLTPLSESELTKTLQTLLQSKQNRSL